MRCSVYVFLFALQFVAISDLKVILISNRKLPGLLVQCQTYFGSSREIMLKCLFLRVNYCGIAAKNIRQKYIIYNKYVSITRVISEVSVILDTQSNATNTFIADIFTQSIFDIFIALLRTMIQSFSIVFAGYKMLPVSAWAALLPVQPGTLSPSQSPDTLSLSLSWTITHHTPISTLSLLY